MPEALPLVQTPQAWLTCVLENFDEFLSDHASCEKKASGMALSIAAHYPDRPQLLRAMVDLAVEELSHYREVMRLLLDRGVTPLPDGKDPYIHAMNQRIRRGPDVYLLDRLLVATVIEARGHERFALLANALPSGREAQFYRSIAASEDRHWQLFYELALTASKPTTEVKQAIDQRLDELIADEAQILGTLPLRAALH